MGMKAVFKGMKNGYVRFVEKQGFAIITVLCVAVITATALWTGKEEVYVSPTPPVSSDVSAAQLIQESLREATTPTPSPTEAPRQWLCPLEEAVILQPYSTSSMVQSQVTGIWSVHDGIDLQASQGSKVRAMSDGIVLDAGEDQLRGVWLLIDHGDGIEALYAGLAMAAAYIAGDSVRSGDVIGFVGAGLLEESNLGPHLHLRVTLDGASIDPTLLWTSASTDPGISHAHSDTND